MELPHWWTRASPSDSTPTRRASAGDWLVGDSGPELRVPPRKKVRQHFPLYLPIQCWEENLCR